MGYRIQASCLCSIGAKRRNNEDNFYFDGKTLEEENEGLRNPVSIDTELTNGLCMAIFDGMGGENFGESASYAAARKMQSCQRTFADFFIPEKKYLGRMTAQLNAAVLAAADEKGTRRMGSTMVSLYYTARMVYVCNLGDSRAYRLRDGEFSQMSRDHISTRPMPAGKKPPLTQHLGIDPEDMLIEPHIVKAELRKGDQYLLCSDGLTDMVENVEISDILLRSETTEECVSSLVQAAMEHGGRDNITVILCSID